MTRMNEAKRTRKFANSIIERYFAAGQTRILCGEQIATAKRSPDCRLTDPKAVVIEQRGFVHVVQLDLLGFPLVAEDVDKAGARVGDPAIKDGANNALSRLTLDEHAGLMRENEMALPSVSASTEAKGNVRMA